MIDSNLPIMMYGIGAGVENEWATSKDENIREFYNRRNILPYNAKYEELDLVANGSAIFVDWLTSLGHIKLR